MGNAQVVIYGVVGRGIVGRLLPQIVGEEVRRGGTVDLKEAERLAEKLRENIKDEPTDCNENLYVRVERCR